MPNESTRTRQRERNVKPLDDEPETSGVSPLLQHAQGFVNVAREANNDCAKGDQAEKELHARRNESGQ